jgi:hypothetical protein
MRLRPEVLTITSDVPLQLPPVCARCGRHTDQTRAITLSAEKHDRLIDIAGFLLPVAHIAGMIARASRESVDVPCCLSCRRRAFKIVGAGVLASMAGVALILFTLDRWDYLLVFVAGAMFVVGVMMLSGVFMAFLYARDNTVPVDVTLENGKYIYTFRGGPFVDWAKGRNEPAGEK